MAIRLPNSTKDEFAQLQPGDILTVAIYKQDKPGFAVRAHTGGFYMLSARGGSFKECPFLGMRLATMRMVRPLASSADDLLKELPEVLEILDVEQVHSKGLVRCWLAARG
ncbi:hypothetical protein EAH74_12070 [Pseudomonas mandelii]|uniref:Uncharacterized protein n=1 Tax=Pseudomonas mandelii TaxID=75612 RepID=A0A502IGM8_9PSED|nr:hypothetical protein EAH74_12070 [Pseudomonas mandelii]